nr:MAG TPA: hypothetical protein [Caudoviricetes sp.]
MVSTNVDIIAFLKNSKCHWSFKSQVYQGLTRLKNVINFCHDWFILSF